MATPLQLNKLQTQSRAKYIAKRSNFQRVYKQLQLNKIKNVTSYQVNNDMFIVVPLDKE